MRSIFDISADLQTPVSAFLRLRDFNPRFLLESVEAGHAGRYSFIGFGDSQTVSIDPDGVRLDGELLASEVLDGLRLALGRVPRMTSAENGQQPFDGGLVGVTAFDLVRRLYKLPESRHQRLTPDGAYVATSSTLVFDHLTRRMALLHSGSELERETLRSEVKAALRGPIPELTGASRYESPDPSMSRSEFMNGVERVKGHIRDGDVYQLVLSVQFTGQTDIDPFTAYRAMRLTNPSPYMYFVDTGDRQVVGSSPEALCRLNGRTAELRPIAGTRPRGQSREEDNRLEQELLNDPKEAAEHVMLVDLARNDVGRTAQPGSVLVDPYMTIERYSHVMHMVSGVTAEIRPDVDEFDVFAATFPAGTVSGAPKLRSIELIDELEPVGRGLYSGSTGYFGHAGAMDQAITIRTLVFEEDRYRYQAGAGIVADSDPEMEHEEVLAKGAAMESALQIAGEGL